MGFLVSIWLRLLIQCNSIGFFLSFNLEGEKRESEVRKAAQPYHLRYHLCLRDKRCGMSYVLKLNTLCWGFLQIPNTEYE